jgi:protein-tyrosine phosphatase
MTNARAEPIRVLFVCRGNTCRSPMAQAAVSALHPQMTAQSCGLLDLRLPASAEAIALARQRYGVDLSAHVSRCVASIELDAFDYVIGMTPRIAAELLHNHDVREGRVVAWDVSDPVGQDMPAYERAADQIERHLAEFMRRGQ